MKPTMKLKAMLVAVLIGCVAIAASVVITSWVISHRSEDARVSEVTAQITKYLTLRSTGRFSEASKMVSGEAEAQTRQLANLKPDPLLAFDVLEETDASPYIIVHGIVRSEHDTLVEDFYMKRFEDGSLKIFSIKIPTPTWTSASSAVSDAQMQSLSAFSSALASGDKAKAESILAGSAKIDAAKNAIVMPVHITPTNRQLLSTKIVGSTVDGGHLVEVREKVVQQAPYDRDKKGTHEPAGEAVTSVSEIVTSLEALCEIDGKWMITEVMRVNVEDAK